MIMILVVITIFVIGSVVLARQSKERKATAIADLEREKDEVAQIDIFVLIAAEVEDLGLRSISGAEGIQSAVLLKAWKNSVDIVQRCEDRSHLRFVLSHGVAPGEAALGDVTVVCTTPSTVDPPLDPTDEQM